MGFKRPEVRILSPRPVKVGSLDVYIWTAGFFYVMVENLQRCGIINAKTWAGKERSCAESVLAMEFGEKLQELRKRKGLTQEELAEFLYVSRTAVSKWESGRGYPNIDSLKAIAKFFAVTIDELLSGDELMTIAEEDNRQKEGHLRNLVFALLDMGAVMLFILPFFAQREGGNIREVSLWALNGIAPWVKIACFAAVIAIVASGIAALVLRNAWPEFWDKNKEKISLALSAVGVLLFIVSLQPYAAALLLVFLIIKALLLIRWP